MARTTTRRTHRAPGSQPARRTRKTPIRSQTPQRRCASSRTSLAQRRDLVGGGLIALGTFLAFVEYRGWDGGVVGLAHLLRATLREYQKMGKILTAADLEAP